LNNTQTCRRSVVLIASVYVYVCVLDGRWSMHCISVFRAGPWSKCILVCRYSVQPYIVNINLFVKGKKIDLYSSNRESWSNVFSLIGGPKSRRAALWVALRDGPTRAVENLPPRCLLMRFSRNMMYYLQASYCRYSYNVIMLVYLYTHNIKYNIIYSENGRRAPHQAIS